jgi:hypothetical protein
MRGRADRCRWVLTAGLPAPLPTRYRASGLVTAAVTALPARDGAGMDNHIPARLRARVTPDPQPTDSPRVPGPVRLLAARRHLAADRSPRLTVLVDRVPRLDELAYQPVDMGQVRPLPGLTLYIGVHPGGLVIPLVDIGDGRGFYGQTMRLRMVDGTIRPVTGPYLVGPDLIDVFVPELGIRTDVAVTDDHSTFEHHSDGRDTIRAGLLGPIADVALRMAIYRGLRERSQPSRAFDGITWPSTTGHDADPSSGDQR